MFKKINRCDIYIGLWIIYMLQGVIYSPGIINQFLQLLILLWSMVALYKYISLPLMRCSSILKATFLLIIMYVVYGSIHIMFGERMILSNYVYLQSSLKSLVPIFLFFYFTSKGYLTSNRIRLYLPILIVTCILLYYKNETSVMLIKDKEEITNNMGYLFTALIPFLFFFYKKPLLQYIYMGIILLFIFLSMKRGSILIGVVGSIILIYSNLKYSSRKNKLLTLFFSASIIIGCILYINYMMLNSEYFAFRIEQTLDGNSSGRDQMYSDLLKMLLHEHNIFHFLFGRGADSTIRFIGNYAHQDWLETFCNNGLLGVVVMFTFFFVFGIKVRNSKKQIPSMMYYSFVALFIITFSKTLFSMSIQNLDFFQSLLIGYFSYISIDSYKNPINLKLVLSIQE